MTQAGKDKTGEAPLMIWVKVPFTLMTNLLPTCAAEGRFSGGVEGPRQVIKLKADQRERTRDVDVCK